MEGQRFVLRLIFLICLFGVACQGCAQTPASGQRDDLLEGEVRVSGAWALYPLMLRWGETFQNLHPGVQFHIAAGGTDLGMEQLLAGEVGIAMASRPVDEQEIARGAVWMPVARDAVFPTINMDNPYWDALNQRGVTQREFEQIFISREINNWGELIGQPENSEPIHVYTRSDAAGGAATWAQFLGGTQADLLGEGADGEQGILAAVARDPLGIGYNSVAYAFDLRTRMAESGIRILPIDLNENGVADPEECFQTLDQAMQAVSSGDYPSPPARELYLVVKGKPTAPVSDLLAWILQDGQSLVRNSGLLELAGDGIQGEFKP